ncbi:MAG TPA: SDR family oxidoreductase [Acidobacteriota bacterium]|nr:SDR family oxidoreductase [Acidobacteriota bacterium]
MKLKDKRAIVTGSTKGIGRAIAESLIKEGAKVVVSARTAEEVEATVKQLNSLSPGSAAGRVCDVRDAEQVKALIEFALAEFEGLEILINNAGLGIFKNVEELSVGEWRTTLQTNLDSLFYGCHYALPHLKKHDNSFIINIGSLAGKNAFPGGAAYNASKFGLIGFSEALMQEVRHDGVRVAYVMPGSVETWFRGSAPASHSWKLSAQDVADVTLDTLKRDPRCLTSRIEMRPSRPPKK